MTPERLQEMRDRDTHGAAAEIDSFDPFEAAIEKCRDDRRNLLGYIDTLHAEIAALRGRASGVNVS